MSDPLRCLYGSPQAAGDLPSDTPHELIEYRDRVAFAAALIRDHELRLWFESNWRLARQIARLCPECQVFSIPTGARWIDALDSPPAWLRRREVGAEI